MPVTARLSRRFYEKFGDEIVNELVEWFNQVDTTYRSEVRELNEANFARFRELNEANYGRFDAKLEQMRADLRAEIQSLKAEMIKWMFLFWAGTALGGLLLR
jgi:hypothetical protein